MDAADHGCPGPDDRGWVMLVALYEPGQADGVESTTLFLSFLEKAPLETTAGLGIRSNSTIDKPHFFNSSSRQMTKAGIEMPAFVILCHCDCWFGYWYYHPKPVTGMRLTCRAFVKPHLSPVAIGFLCPQIPW